MFFQGFEDVRCERLFVLDFSNDELETVRGEELHVCGVGVGKQWQKQAEEGFDVLYHVPGEEFEKVRQTCEHVSDDFFLFFEPFYSFHLKEIEK